MHSLSGFSALAFPPLPETLLSLLLLFSRLPSFRKTGWLRADSVVVDEESSRTTTSGPSTLPYVGSASLLLLPPKLSFESGLLRNSLRPPWDEALLVCEIGREEVGLEV